MDTERIEIFSRAIIEKDVDSDDIIERLCSEFAFDANRECTSNIIVESLYHALLASHNKNIRWCWDLLMKQIGTYDDLKIIYGILCELIKVIYREKIYHVLIHNSWIMDYVNANLLVDEVIILEMMTFILENYDEFTKNHPELNMTEYLLGGNTSVNYSTRIFRLIIQSNNKATKQIVGGFLEAHRFFSTRILKELTIILIENNHPIPTGLISDAIRFEHIEILYLFIKYNINVKMIAENMQMTDEQKNKMNILNNLGLTLEDYVKFIN